VYVTCLILVIVDDYKLSHTPSNRVEQRQVSLVVVAVVVVVVVVVVAAACSRYLLSASCCP